MKETVKESCDFLPKSFVGLSILFDVSDGVDAVIDARKPLMGPSVDIDVCGNAEPMKGIGLFMIQDGGPHHFLGDEAIRSGDELFDEAPRGIFMRTQSCVAGKKMEGYPNQTCREFGVVSIIQHSMCGGHAPIHGSVVETDDSVVGGVVDVLCRVGYRSGLMVVESRDSPHHVGHRMVKIDVHI